MKWAPSQMMGKVASKSHDSLLQTLAELVDCMSEAVSQADVEGKPDGDGPPLEAGPYADEGRPVASSTSSSKRSSSHLETHLPRLRAIRDRTKSHFL